MNILVVGSADSSQKILSTKTVINSINNWQAPSEYLKDNVSDTVIKIIMRYYHKTKFLGFCYGRYLFE